MTLKLSGMYSSCSDTSSPKCRNLLPQSRQQSCPGTCVTTSRSRCSGRGLRSGLVFGSLAGETRSSTASISAWVVSSSSRPNSSCSSLITIFSLFLPNIMCRSFSIMSFMCSIRWLRVRSSSACWETVWRCDSSSASSLWSSSSRSAISDASSA